MYVVGDSILHQQLLVEMQWIQAFLSAINIVPKT